MRPTGSCLELVGTYVDAMKDERKTKKLLIEELEAQRARVDELSANMAEFRHQRAVEMAAEHIRVEALSMYASDDLLHVVVMMWRELSGLGIETPACAFFFVDEKGNRIVSYVALENPRKHGISWTSPDVREIDEDSAVSVWTVPITSDWEGDLARWRAGNLWSGVRNRENDEAETRQFHEVHGFSAG